MAEQNYNVLFLCTGNSARSLMAEAILNAEGSGRFRAFSAGSRPKDAPHPYTLDLLRRLGHDVSELRSKDWSEFEATDAPHMDFVFTVCDRAAAKPCPVWSRQPMTAHWGVPDPVAVTGGEAERRVAFSDAYKILARRIHLFGSLPLEAIDRLALKRRLDDIGQVGAAERAD
ncbi:MAG: arsenate reductase ArsC [Pseudomonadota bacterium]